ncbi:MAG: hypothetical protein ACKPKO_17370, partial [Candidatus Fonsibacter sp.]
MTLNAALIVNYYLNTETYNQTETNDKLSLKLNASIINDYYNKLYIDNLISNYYLKTETYNQTEIIDKLALKLNSSGRSNYYNKLETDNFLNEKQNEITSSTALSLA